MPLHAFWFVGRLGIVSFGVCAGGTATVALAGIVTVPLKACETTRFCEPTHAGFGKLAFVVASATVTLTPVIAPLQILFLAFVPRAAYKLSESVAFAHGKAAQMALRQAILLLLLGLGAFIGAKFGVRGVAFGVAIAVWIFYLVSLAWAARLINVAAASLALIHVRAIAIAAAIGLGAQVALVVSHPLGFWGAHIASALGAAIVFALLFLAPSSVLGRDLDWARRETSAMASRYVPGLARLALNRR